MIITSQISEIELATINTRLRDLYGRCEPEGLSNFRVVWSEDQLEKRKMTHSDGGLLLLNPEVREVPKYRQWIQTKYILERLTIISEYVETDLVERLSYEPVFVFEDKHGNALAPLWSAIHFIVENLLHAEHHVGYVKYKDPNADPTDAKEREFERIETLKNDLFGNETEIGDALAHKEGISVPNREFK